MQRTIRLVLAAFAFLFAGQASAQLLYAANGSGGNLASLVILNPATGAVVQTIGPIGFAVTGIAFHPITRQLYGSTGGQDPVVANRNSLIRISTTTGAGTMIGQIAAGGPTADITFAPDGTLYGWSEATDDLVTINLSTGLGTPVGDSGLSTFGSGTAYAPGGLVYHTSAGSLYAIDPRTGLPVRQMPIALNMNALAFSPTGQLFGSASNANALYTIEPSTGAITLVGPSIANLDAIAFGPAAAFGVPSVPTLSQWALLVLTLVLGVAGMRAVRRR
jgi:DNA-binding beta-propeller fold protein YncE